MLVSQDTKTPNESLDASVEEIERHVLRANICASFFYACDGLAGYISPVISFAMFVGIAVYYTLPTRFRILAPYHTTTDNTSEQ